MKKIAICTLFHHNFNYGGILQAYALEHFLLENGYDTEVIDYDDANTKNPIYPTLVSRCEQYSFQEILIKVWEMLSEKINRSFHKKIAKRKILFKEFVRNHITHSQLVNDSMLMELVRKYSVFIVGSDQVWNPNALRKLYLQDFKHSCNSTVISYAASISRNFLSEKEKGCMIPAISAFDALSVREKSAKQLLLDYGIKKDIKVVCDPVMLLTTTDWDKVASPRQIEKPYVLMYAFSRCPFLEEVIAYYKEKNVDCYYIPYAKLQPNSFDEHIPMNQLMDIGPSQFVSLIKYAEAVITDSFHGIVFSIIYKRPIYVYERDRIEGKTSKNSRVYDVLSTFGMNERMVRNDFLHKIDDFVDYSTIYDKLQILRLKSGNWLLDNMRL